MKYLYFWLFAFTYFLSIAGNYTDITPPIGLPQSSQTGMCFLNIDNDDDLEFVYSYIENDRQVTRIYQTKNGNIINQFFEVEDKFLTHITPVSFTNNDEIQFLAIEPFKNGDKKFSLFEILTDDNDRIIGLEEIATSFSSIFFDKITYDIFDFDSDGDLDIFFIGEGSSTVTEVLLNQGNYIFKNIPLQLPEYTNATIAHYDFTEDGFQDVYLAGIVGNDTIGKLFRNVNGKFLESFKETESLDIPAVVNGQVIIQRFNNNSFPDFYIRGEKDTKQYSGIYELQLKTKSTQIPTNQIQKINDLPYFSNGITSIHDFNNDGFYDLFTSGFFPNAQGDKMKTQISYQNTQGGLQTESLESLYLSNVSVADIDQNGSLEIIATGETFDQDLNDEISRTIVYSNNFTENTAPSFNDPINDIKTNINENQIRISWNPAKDNETNEQIIFYEVHFSTKEKKFTGNSSDPDGIRFFPSKGIVQDTFLILNDIPVGEYIISVQAIDNGLLASKASVPKNITITFELPKEYFDTFEIVQFRNENFENKFKIVDLDADGYKDFLLLDKTDELSFLVQKEINVFEKSPLFDQYTSENHHFELGDYSLDGYVDVWFLEGDSIENELYIFDTEDSTLHTTDITNLESFVLLDIDNDLDLDIIAESKTQNGTVFYENNDGEFELIIFSYDEFLEPVGVYDFNKDSYADFYFITDTIINGETFQNAYLGINNYNGNLGKNKNLLFTRKKILADQKFKVIDGLDAGNDGDWDLLIEKEEGYAILENKGGGKWEITALPFNHKFDKNKTQVRLADFDGDLKEEVWHFSIDTLEIYYPQTQQNYQFATEIFNKDGNWGNTKGQKALQWIKIVDLNADGWNDLLAHVIINDKAQTYYFPNDFDKNIPSIKSPTNLIAKPSIGRATLKWKWENTNDSQAEYLLEMKQMVYDGDDTISAFLNFDAIHTIDNLTSTQIDDVNYLGSSDSLQINNLLEGDYVWRIVSKIENRFSDWSTWDTLRIHNFLKEDSLIPPVHHTNYKNLELKGTSKFSKSADFDNDGDLDFLFIGHKNYLYINNENKKFDTIPLNNLPIYGYADVKIINYDHDDFPDLMISGVDNDWKIPSCAIYRNTKNNTFTKVADFPALAFGSMDQADIDNDGDLDYVITGKNAKEEFKNYFIRDKRLPFAKEPKFDTTSFIIDKNEFNQVKAQFIDSDNDGLMDLFCTVYNTKNSKENYLLVKNNREFNTINKTEVAPATKEISASYEFVYTNFGDYDNDGYLDLILVGLSPNSTTSTTGTFENEKNYYKDAFLSTSDKTLNWTIKLYQGAENTFHQTNELPSITLGQNRIQNIQFWDIENDGDLDFFIQQVGHIIFIEKNDNGNFEQSSQMRINGNFAFSSFGDFKAINSDTIRDTRLDFITGNIESSYQYTLEKNNIANQNSLPIKPESIVVEDPFDGSTEGIFNGISAKISWEAGTDDDEYGTESTSMQYAVSVYRNQKDTLLYNYEVHNNSLTLEKLEDGDYHCEIKSIDQGFEKSKSVAIDSFTIWMDPIIVGNDSTCEDQLTTYRFEPNHQNYIWKIFKKDTVYTLASIDLNTDSIRVMWDTSSTFIQKITITNDTYPTKTTSLPIEVFRKPFADFSYGKEISLGAEILFTNLSGNFSDAYAWFVDDEKISNERDFTHIFTNSGENEVSLNVSNEIGCNVRKDTTINVENNVIINTSAFVTQNNDGKNDFLYIEHLDRYSNNKITIFNQWGQELYTIENYSNNWEEIMGDEKLPIGNYFLIIDVFVNDSETQTFKSTFSVLK